MPKGVYPHKSLTAETKARMSAARKGHTVSTETRAKIATAVRGNTNGRARKGQPLTEAHKKALSQAHKGKPLSEAHKKASANARRGRHLTAEHRQKIRASQPRLGTAKPKVRRPSRRNDAAARAKISAALKGRPGRPLTLEQREALRRSSIVHASLDLPHCRCWIHGKPSKPSYIEGLLSKLLKPIFPDLVAEKPVGRYRVDFYSPSRHIAFEADGQRWHKPERDRKRDAYLRDTFGLPVVRFTGKELLDWQHSLIGKYGKRPGQRNTDGERLSLVISGNSSAW